MRIPPIIYVLFILYGCQNAELSYPPIISQSDIRIDSIQFEKIELDLQEYECSYYGFSFVKDRKIYYMDKYFCWLFIFSDTGELLSRELGQGRGPKEVVCKRISSISSCQNGDLLVMGYTLDHYFFNKELEKTKAFLLENNKEKKIAENSNTYTTFYPNLEIKNADGSLYYNIYAEANNFNFIDTPKKYYLHAKTLMEADLNNGKVKRVLGNYPPFYQNGIGKYNAFLSLNYNFDIQGHLYVAYEADSTIYKYEKTGYPVQAFGYMGKDMNRDYKRIESWKNFGTLMHEERQNKGYYTSLFVSPVNNYVLRTYQKGCHSPNDGIQIYQNGILIGDVEIPKSIKINGYMAPYYYSEIIADTENEKLYIYRFQL